jgi:hypothetical protein
MFYLQKLICNAEHRGTKRQVLQDKIQSWQCFCPRKFFFLISCHFFFPKPRQ